MLQSPTNAVAEAAARESYGKLLAWLAWKWRDISAAEDALAEAFATALSHWPREGVPAKPEAWLLTVAKRHLLMMARRRRLEEDPAVSILLPELIQDTSIVPALPDMRLRLLFVCAHPAIDRSMHAALMLQLVLGIDAARIASAYLVSPTALTKRLSRAKAKIRDAGIPFVEPEKSELPSRVESVLEAIYGMYTLNDSTGMDLPRSDLADEALFLARLVADHAENDAEAQGLFALLLYRESRRTSSHEDDECFVPLDEQNPRHWRRELIECAEARLRAAVALKLVGHYQIEAAIQAAHMQSVIDGKKRWLDICQLYEQLLQLGPTIGAHIGHAVSTARANEDPDRGLALLDSIDAGRVVSHQPWWAARAALLAIAGRRDEARAAYARTIALTGDKSTRTWLERRAERLQEPSPNR